MGWGLRMAPACPAVLEKGAIPGIMGSSRQKGPMEDGDRSIPSWLSTCVFDDG